MNVKNKHVFFYCDECELLDPVIAIFRHLHPQIDVHVLSDLEELISCTRESAPELILVYLSKPDHDFIAAVKYIRENVSSASIPVVIYQQLPDKEELKDLFKKLI